MLNKDIYKKATPDLIVGEVLRITKKFELYASGKEQLEILTNAISTQGEVLSNEEEEFFTGGIPY